MTEPIKWHEPEDSSKYITDEYIERVRKMYNPVEFRRHYLNEPNLNKPTRRELEELSDNAKAARMPQKPEELIGALQDPVHRDVERSRPARVSRSRIHENHQY